MRKIIYITLLCLLSQAAMAQTKLEIKPYLEYSYNPIYQSQGVLGLVSDYKATNNCTLRLGLQANSANLYSATAAAKVYFGKFYLDNTYLYRSFVRSNSQELAIALSAGYEFEHFRLQLGYNYRLFTQIKTDNRSIMKEPANIIYLFEYQLFPKFNKWNIGARISNIDYFIIERYGNPIVSLLADYKINDQLNLFALVSSRPSGVFNMSMNFWGISTRIGVNIVW